ncbi:MAG: 6-carboxytetrahydropterin synthase QueD [Candidatus Omnitrophica bacterium]|nr:6-carboxytetrahydropterin synthase QueD [Candidatus Omnitrophota bacterium]MBD3268611.1 6-carboxytetrahydropterin synthase QueD [Candidatus Omnitrophota bacterium]
MYRVKIVTQFSAAHSLKNYRGKCESLHGHNWKVEVILAGEETDSSGMIMDFARLKKITNEVLEKLDHKYLNDLECFSGISPSSEEISKYIFKKLKKNAENQHCRLDEVRVWETDSSCAMYRE